MTDAAPRGKPKLLLHACCAPCSPHALNLLRENWDVVLFFYNPNIEPDEERDMRAEEMKKLSQATGAELAFGENDNERWRQAVAGLEGEPEGGARCAACFRFRLERAAAAARELGASAFATTLSVSPHKNAATINQQGAAAALSSGVEFLESDFKKNDGFKKSCELSRLHGFRRQNYCGCSFSKRD